MVPNARTQQQAEHAARQDDHSCDQLSIRTTQYSRGVNPDIRFVNASAESLCPKSKFPPVVPFNWRPPESSNENEHPSRRLVTVRFSPTNYRITCEDLVDSNLLTA